MSLPYYPMYPRDFFEGTQEMSLELKGAYIMVLNLMYTRGGPISDEPGFVSRYVGCSIRKWKQVRDELVALGKLRVEAGMISNSRADEVLEKQRSYQDKQSENRARPNKNNDEESPPRTTHAKSKPEPEPKVDDLPRVAAPQYADLTEEFLDELEASCRKWANGSLASRAGPLVLAPIIRLLRPVTGQPVLMDDVRTGIMRAAESLHKRGEKVGISYFEKPILQARDERLRPNPEPELSNGRHERPSTTGGRPAYRGRGPSTDLIGEALAHLVGGSADPDIIEHTGPVRARVAAGGV